MFLSSNILSVIGITLFDIVFIIYAKSFPNPELAISAVTFISTIPYIGDFIIGYISDKTKDKFKMVMIMRLLQALLYIIFAILVGFSHSWIIFGIVIFINFISDLAGTYTSYLSLPITKNIVEQRDLTDARSFQSGIMRSIDLVGKLFGATLIVLLQYNFAFFGILNAMFFILSFIVLWVNKERFQILIPIMKVDYKKENSQLFGYINTFFVDCVNNLKILIDLKQLFHFTLLFSIINLISSAQFSLLPLTYVSNESLQFGSFGFTIAIIGTVETIGVILGALLPLSFFRNKSIELNLILEILITVAIIATIIFLQDKYVLLVLTFLAGYFLGLSNPRIDSFIMIVAPEQSISSVTSIFYTLVQLTLPLGSAIFLLIANMISIQISWIILFIVSLFTLIYSITLRMKNSTIPEKR
ncbi:MFS transporter [Bacillus fungorum]